MIFKKEHLQNLPETERVIIPVYARDALKSKIPKYEMEEKSMLPRTAYGIISDELILDGNSRLNLATFVSTWMEKSNGKRASAREPTAGDRAARRCCTRIC